MNPFSPVLAASAPTGMGGGGWGTDGRGGFIEFLLPHRDHFFSFAQKHGLNQAPCFA